jgi:diguanylate cyclase (GGDEF)-like protein
MDLSQLKERNLSVHAALREGQRPLPSPSAVALQLMQAVDRRDVGVFEVCRIARADPMLVARTVQMANSALYAGLRQTAAMEDAVMRIGVSALARLAVGLSLVHGNQRWSGSFDLGAYWRRALARALALQHLARRQRNLPASEAFSLGLLADVGRLAMVAAFGDAAAADVAAQRAQWGFDEHQASAALLDAWSFPASLWLAVLPSSRESAQAGGRVGELAQMVVLARELAAALDESRRELSPLCLRGARFGLDADGIGGVLEQIGAELPAMAGLLELKLPPAQAQSEFQRLRQALSARPPIDDGAGGGALLLAAPTPAADALRRALLEAGVAVEAAGSATQGFELLGTSEPDVLVLDADLPGLDALALCHQQRLARGAALYVLVLSAEPGSDAVLQALDAGANDVLAKPVEHKLLVAKVKLGERAVRLVAALERERRAADGAQRELSRSNEDLRVAAYTDELTGLPNRRALDEFLRGSASDTLGRGDPLSCVLVDLDHFKRINDTHGHDAGDRVLCSVARVLQAQTRATDMLARWGGEELVLVCPGAPLDAAARLAERMRLTVERLQQAGLPQLTLSAGVAQAGGDGVAAMLRAADAALLQAKRAGRNRVVRSELSAPRS